jgi:hypothetical protein
MSLPSGISRCSETSRRILAIVSILFVPFGPSGRDDPDIGVAFGVDNEVYLTLIKTEQDRFFLVVVFRRVDPFFSLGPIRSRPFDTDLT